MNKSRVTIAVLLLVIVVLGSVALYYSPLLNSSRMTGQATMTQLVSGGGQLDSVAIYAATNRSVVTVQGVAIDQSGFFPTLASVLGTGFVVTYSNSYYVVTNFHVMDGLENATVTFSDGDAYPAKLLGSDAYSDLAILSVNAAASEFHPLQLGVSSSLRVGESVVAIGNPYGLSGTITVGIVSQVGRTLQEDTAGGFAIADTIQFSAPINPGNSGGPLLNGVGAVVGITTATTSGSQGLGFAIPSDTISRELPALVKNGVYNGHAYLGLELVDMNYQLSQAMKTNTTWGVLVENVVQGGPASQAGLRGGAQNATIQDQKYIIGGDIIVSFNGNKIVNYDALSAWMERNAVPGQTVQVGIIRAGTQMTIPVKVGTRPPLPTG
ncbi:MAG TPA: trypsin-like peptidase domain-containing protein [Terriglobales bacterium]|nr:trypsin-like peptidase domain-containing protein [Terriglobales bacterium]